MFMNQNQFIFGLTVLSARSTFQLKNIFFNDYSSLTTYYSYIHYLYIFFNLYIGTYFVY